MTAESNRPDLPTDLLKKADQLRLAGTYDQAKIVLQELIKTNPFFAPAKLGLGRVYFESGDLANARSILEEFSEFVPDHSLANKILAKIYIYFQQDKKARDKIQSVLDVSPEDSMAKKMLQEIEEASSFQEENLDNEDTKKNTVPTSTATIAEIYRNQGHLAEALEIYQELLMQSSNNPIYQQRIAEIQNELHPPQTKTVSQTADTVEIDPLTYSKSESSVPEFRRVEMTDEKTISSVEPDLSVASNVSALDFSTRETVELEPMDQVPASIAPEVHQRPNPEISKSNPGRVTRQEKLERMLYLVQQHRKGMTNV